MAKVRKMVFELVLIIISVLVTGTIAIRAHLSDSKKEKELSDKTEEIVNLQKELIRSGNETKQKQSDLIKEQKDNIILSEKILKFQEKLDLNSKEISNLTKEVALISKNTEGMVNYIRKDIDDLMLSDFYIQIRIVHLGAKDYMSIPEYSLSPYTIEFWQEDDSGNKKIIGRGECTEMFSDSNKNRFVQVPNEKVIVNSKINFSRPEIARAEIFSVSNFDKSKRLYFQMPNLLKLALYEGGALFYVEISLVLKRNGQLFHVRDLKISENDYKGYFSNLNF